MSSGADLSVPSGNRVRVGRYAAAAVVIIIGGLIIASAATNPRFGWKTVGEWLFARTIMKGLLITCELTVVAMTAGIVLGTVLAIMRRAQNPIVSGAAAGYIWLFRGTPLLVQLLFWFNFSALYPTLRIGLPLGGPTVASFSANDVITPVMAAFLGLALHEAAYMAEIVRAGIVSVPSGQLQAASALGMSRRQTMLRIVLPQAMRVIIPPTGNQTISMLKTTSLVSVLAIPDLLYSAQIIYSRSFQTIPLLIVATILYLITVSLLSLVQHWVERKVSPDQSATGVGRLPRTRRVRALLDAAGEGAR